MCIPGANTAAVDLGFTHPALESCFSEWGPQGTCSGPQLSEAAAFP